MEGNVNKSPEMLNDHADKSQFLDDVTPNLNVLTN